jgi:hypothetical protein
MLKGVPRAAAAQQPFSLEEIDVDSSPNCRNDTATKCRCCLLTGESLQIPRHLSGAPAALESAALYALE